MAEGVLMRVFQWVVSLFILNKIGTPYIDWMEIRVDS